jgi:hypothetical protein
MIKYTIILVWSAAVYPIIEDPERTLGYFFSCLGVIMWFKTWRTFLWGFLLRQYAKVTINLFPIMDAMNSPSLKKP